MPTTVKIRRSGTASATPSALEHGEIAINYADGKVFWKNASNVITSFTFQSYALASHTHAASDITSGTLDAARLPLATTGAAGAVIVGTGLGVSSGTVSVTYGTSSGTACQGNDSRLSDARTPTSHSHGNITNAGAIGSTADQFVVTTTSGVLTAVSAATARTTLSVQPTASPAFTGAATFANTGDVVPLTVTNTGTVNSFVVNDASPDTSPFVIDAAGRVGIGASPSSSGSSVFQARGDIDIHGSDSDRSITYNIGVGDAGITGWYRSKIAFVPSGAANNISQSIVFSTKDGDLGGSALTERFRIGHTGTATFAGQVLVTAGSKTTCSVAPTGDPDTGMFFPLANTLALSTGDVERVRVDASGNVGIGCTPAALLDLGSATGVKVFTYKSSGANAGIGTDLSSAAYECSIFAGGTADTHGRISFGRRRVDTGTYTERMVIDASGNVGIGVTPTQRLHVVRSGTGIAARFTDNSTQTLDIGVTASAGVYYDNPNSGYHEWQIGGSGKMRLESGGDVVIGTTNANPAGNNVAGCRITSGGLLNISRNQDISAFFNRMGNDGAIIWFLQAGTVEGDISVAGNTVSYNAFCGSHWGQLSDQSRREILRGTVMETIDEMCDWPEDGGSSDRLVRVKVSDTPASRRVYGVFLGWDEKYASTGDMYVAGLGAYMVRVSGVVQSGDLLESAGDGTARTQADDLVRSTTIGKVSSTHRIAEYDDGSYLVPCVLMCG